MEENIEEQGVQLPELPQVIEAQPTEEVKPNPFSEDMREDLDDLTTLSEEDKAWAFGTAGIDKVDEPEELEDLFSVTEEDIMGDDEPETPKPQPKYRITPTRKYPPSTSMGGMQS